MDTQPCQNHGPVRLLVPLLEFNQGPKEPGEHAEPSEPPLTRPISPGATKPSHGDAFHGSKAAGFQGFQ